MMGVVAAALAVAVGAALVAAGSAIPAAAATPRDTLVIGMSTGILITLDPAAVYEVEGAVIVDQLYDKLVELAMVDGRIEVVPEAAETWQLADDGVTWTFFIREGMRFPSGRPITAHDVEYSIRRAVRLNRGPAWLRNQIGFTPDNVTDTVRALDERRLQLRVSQPFAPNLVLSILTFPLTSIVDREVVEAHLTAGDLATDYLKDHSAGSGPYRLVRWEPNQIVELEANPTYWRGAPPIRRIIIRDMPEPSAQRLAIERGDIDVAWSLTPLMRKELTAQGRTDLRVVQVPGHGIEYLAMNVKYEPLSHPKVREAIRWAIDYDAILDDILLGEAIPLQTFIPTGYFGHNPARPYTRDVERARQLLAEAGYPNGCAVELVTNTGSATRADVAQIIQSNLADIGIRVQITLMQAGPMYEKYREQGLQMIVAGWGVDYPDPDALAKPFADGSVRQLAWRNAWYDEEATRLTAEAMVERNSQRRQALYQQLTELVLHEGPFAILYQPVNAWVVRSNVQGFEEAAALGTMHFDMTRSRKAG
ncbi:MAG: ABC transporter substrate-binding protein [Firmicutes bacterium]|nr:ABC transporter substrate-binding protein [Bacillota bacterium]